ncbi:DUF2293 domain-containing protein [Cohaesibacter celericrescens]|uniref:DUF2293 domain-containing protein n=1 Tax=Cohaesibacter celericrescens TaxID=2067669 RepID=A0A2N5XTW1_9HYPH|nr:DUF2293 domain-containing protein [Cohaesibacter celericrescens]PLW77929.1 hypothetical protein C0081_07350 [Cohaesibacter celericrescens]
MAHQNPERKNQIKHFHRQQIEDALIRHFPHCPQEHSQPILEKVLMRDWDKKTSMTKAVSIVVHNYIRHQMTDYDQIIGKSGITRDEARIIVKHEVQDWFDYWHTGADSCKPEP